MYTYVYICIIYIYIYIYIYVAICLYIISCNVKLFAKGLSLGMQRPGPLLSAFRRPQVRRALTFVLDPQVQIASMDHVSGKIRRISLRPNPGMMISN